MTTREPISIENGRVEIHAPENRVWLTRHQIADLFGVFVPAVGSNIRSILKSGILCEERVYRRERNRDGGIVELYSFWPFFFYTHSCPPIHFFRESSRNFCISDSMYSTLP